jgi:hypothetical protein
MKAQVYFLNSLLKILNLMISIGEASFYTHLLSSFVLFSLNNNYNFVNKIEQ